MKKYLFSTVAVLAVLFSSSCTNDDDVKSCETVFDCDHGYECVDGECVPDSSSNSDNNKNGSDTDDNSGETDKNGGGTTEPDNDQPTPGPCDNDPCLSMKGSNGNCTVVEESFVCGCEENYYWDNEVKRCIRENPCDETVCGEVECIPETYENGDYTGVFECDCKEGYFWHWTEKECKEGELLFFDDFENGNSKWNLSGDWEIGVPDAKRIDEETGDVIQYLNQAASGEKVLATKLNENYSLEHDSPAKIIENFDFSYGETVHFEFKAYLNTDYYPGGFTSPRYYDGAQLLFNGFNIVLEHDGDDLYGPFYVDESTFWDTIEIRHEGIRGKSEHNTYSVFRGSFPITEEVVSGEVEIVFLSGNSEYSYPGVFLDDFFIYRSAPIADPCGEETCKELDFSTEECISHKFFETGFFTGSYECACELGYSWDGEEMKCVKASSPCEPKNPCYSELECFHETFEDDGKTFYTGKYGCGCEYGFVLHEGECVGGELLLYDDFESGMPYKWNLEGDWEIGEPYHSSGWGDKITKAYSGNNVLATKLKGSHSRSHDGYATLKKTFNFSKNDTVYIEFHAYVFTANRKGAVIMLGDDVIADMIQDGDESKNLFGPFTEGKLKGMNGLRGQASEDTYARFYGTFQVKDAGKRDIRIRFYSDDLDPRAGIYIDDFTVLRIDASLEETED